jgi:hypothetical protein
MRRIQGVARALVQFDDPVDRGVSGCGADATGGSGGTGDEGPDVDDARAQGGHGQAVLGGSVFQVQRAQAWTESFDLGERVLAGHLGPVHIQLDENFGGKFPDQSFQQRDAVGHLELPPVVVQTELEAFTTGPFGRTLVVL